MEGTGGFALSMRQAAYGQKLPPNGVYQARGNLSLDRASVVHLSYRLFQA